jgi:SAM-dependent methyltransferase
MQKHWSEVAKRARDRTYGHNMYAGDDSPFLIYKGELLKEQFLPKVPVEGRSVLDVGCGLGGTLRYMIEQHPARLVGCDQSIEMVSQAKINAPEAEILQTDGDRLPFKDEEFDVVYTVTVLQHNPDARRARLLGEICRVSAQDIFLFEDTPVKMPPPSSTPGPYQNFYGRPVGWHAGVCAGHGFELMETERQKTFVSRKVFMRLFGHLNRGPRREGERFSELHLAIEKRTLPITKHLDRVFKGPKGELTMMHFRRSPMTANT